MPTDERSTKGAERCVVHPGSPAVAHCDDCGRALCLTCAIPVRGKVLGTECLAEALGPDAVTEERESGQPHNPYRSLSGAAFGLAVLSTFLPWSRLGEGASIFGAWHGIPRWSSLAALAAVLGLVAWVAVRKRDPARRLDVVLAFLGCVLAVAALMAVIHPPYATHSSFAPWIAFAMGLIALASALAAGRRPLRRMGQHV